MPPTPTPRKRRSRWRQAGLLLEACCWLGVMRVAVLRAPFRRIIRWFHLAPAESRVTPSPADLALAEHIGQAVRFGAAHTPWQSACLVQSLAAMAMLRRRGITGTLYLGVARNVDGAPMPIDAHAWLCCGSMTVTGAIANRQFVTVACFSW